MSKFYVVFNEAKNEGVIFKDKKDAIFASKGEISPGMFGVSSIADCFRECYADEDTGDIELPMYDVSISV